MIFTIINCFPFILKEQSPEYHISAFLSILGALAILFVMLKYTKVMPLTKRNWNAIYETQNIIGQFNYSELQTLPIGGTKSLIIKLFIWVVIAIIVLFPLGEYAFKSLSLYSIN